MNIFSILITVLGLCVFEVVSSIDNAVINADVISTLGEKAKRWFLVWGILIAVFLVRGLLPWLIVWIANPSLGFIGSLTATFSNDPHVLESVEMSKPILLAGGGVFLLFLFIHWLLLEPKEFGLPGEKFLHKHGIWFYAIASVVLASLVWLSLKSNSMMAFGAVVGSSAFFITNGFKQNAEVAESELASGRSNLSDISKLLYLEILDMTFSIDGVLGAFAFTLSVPLIILGNGLGALIVRELTVRNVDNIKKYVFLKNGAMYSIFFLSLVMLLDAFGVEIQTWVAPLITFSVIGYFFWKSHVRLKALEKDFLER